MYLVFNLSHHSFICIFQDGVASEKWESTNIYEDGKSDKLKKRGKSLKKASKVFYYNSLQPQSSNKNVHISQEIPPDLGQKNKMDSVKFHEVHFIKILFSNISYNC